MKKRYFYLSLQGHFAPDGTFEATSVGVVPPPHCESCQTEMTPVSSSEWTCPNKKCSRLNTPLDVGVYPVRVKGKGVGA